jgi:hypothetical protein
VHAVRSNAYQRHYIPCRYTNYLPSSCFTRDYGPSCRRWKKLTQVTTIIASDVLPREHLNMGLYQAFLHRRLYFRTTGAVSIYWLLAAETTSIVCLDRYHVAGEHSECLQHGLSYHIQEIEPPPDYRGWCLRTLQQRPGISVPPSHQKHVPPPITVMGWATDVPELNAPSGSSILMSHRSSKSA